MTDFQACTIEGPLGAHCNNFYTNAPVDYTADQWEAMDFGYLCLSPTDYTTIQSELDQACSVANCTIAQKAQIKTFFDKMRVQP